MKKEDLDLNDYQVIGSALCHNPKCLLKQGGGVAHGSCDCLTVTSLLLGITWRDAEITKLQEEVRKVKAEVYDLQHEERY